LIARLLTQRKTHHDPRIRLGERVYKTGSDRHLPALLRSLKRHFAGQAACREIEKTYIRKEQCRRPA
jgi:hypothetical protein